MLEITFLAEQKTCIFFQVFDINICPNLLSSSLNTCKGDVHNLWLLKNYRIYYFVLAVVEKVDQSPLISLQSPRNRVPIELQSSSNRRRDLNRTQSQAISGISNALASTLIRIL